MWKKIKQKIKQWRIVLITSSTVTAVVISFSLTGWLQLLEWSTYDLFMRLLPVESKDPRIVIVGINENDIQRFGYPINDQQLTQLIEKIKSYQPRVIGLDIYRDLPIDPGHQELLEVFKNTPNLVGLNKIIGTQISSPPMVQMVGFSDLLRDSDNKIRRGLISSLFEGEARLSFSVILSLTYLEEENIRLKQGDEQRKYDQLGKALFKKFSTNDGGYVGQNDKGYQILLNMRRGKEPFTIISMSEIIDQQIESEILKDKIILIGSMSNSIEDKFYSSYSRDDFSALYGVEIHAHLTSQMINAAISGRPLIQTIPDIFEWLLIFFGSFASAIFGAKFIEHKLISIAGIFAVAIILIITYFLLFLNSFWLPLVAPVIAIFISGVISTNYILWDNLKEYTQTLEKKVQERTKELSLSEEKFAKSFRLSPHSMTITSFEDRKYIEVNQSFLDTVSYSLENVIGKTALELNLWVHENERKNFFDRLMQIEEVNDIEIQFRTKSGEIKTILLSAEVIYLSGRKCLLSIFNNITQRKQLEDAQKQAKEAAEEASKVKSKFLAHMSHELRTPLNAILGFSKILDRIPSPHKEYHEYLNIIGRSGEHLLSLINEVLDLSKIEAGKMTLNENDFDFYALLKTIEEMLKLQANTKGLNLIFSVNSDIPQYLQADEKKIRQILINLLNNAIKFTDFGEVILKVNVNPNKMKSKEKLVLDFEVKDTGAGIAPEELDKLFEAFSQTQTGKKSQEGTGLGLPISYQFVKMMRGDIKVDSIEGKGTIFTFNILVKLGDINKIEKTKPKNIIGLAPNQPTYRILIADGNSLNRKLLVESLTYLQFELKEVENREEILSIWENWHPHLIFIHLQMLVTDDYDITELIRKKEEIRNNETSEQISTKIIIITANLYEDQKINDLKNRVDDFVFKPFPENIIFDKIAIHLGVTYIYGEAKVTEESQAIAIEKELSLSNFSIMSQDWLTQLNQAAMEGNDEWLLQLIEEVPSSEITLKNTLISWTNDFRFDKITQIFET